MGEQVAATQFSRADRTRYRQKVRRCLDVFERMLRESRFDFERPMTGLEIELNLVDDHGDPTMRNAEVLNSIADPDFQTELGQFNIEINVAPRPLGGTSLTELEQTLRTDLNHAEDSAHAGARQADDDRHPADPDGRSPVHRRAHRQPALQAAQRADLRRPRRGHVAGHRG